MRSIAPFSGAAALALAALATAPDAAVAACTQTGTNQTCTNSGVLSNASGPAINDTGTLTLTNTASGVIGTTTGNLGVFAATANVTNYGSITGAFGVYGSSGATVTNSGSIAGLNGGVFGGNGLLTVTNSGTITGTNDFGIGSTTGNVIVTNSGTVSGNLGVYAQGGGAAVTNSGTIIGTVNPGIFAENYITLTNSGTITGTYGVQNVGGGAVTVINSGTINATSLAAIFNTGNIFVTNSGTLSSNGYGIESVADGAITLTNSGTITTRTGYAVFAQGTVTVVNSGTITSPGGVASGSNLYLTNSGTITGIQGAQGAEYANVVNTGTIAAVDVGIVSEFFVTAVNNGRITASDASGAGIYAGIAVNVTNTGLISGGRYGIDVLGEYGYSSTIANSGTISGGQYGIRSVGPTTLTNSGIISGGTAALQLYGNDTITLLPGSWIIGAINLGTQTALSINAPNQNLTFSSLAGATLSGNVPFVVLGNRIVSLDPTQFAGSDRNLLAVIGAVAGGLGSASSSTPGGSGALGFAGPGYVAANAEEAFADLFGYAKTPGDAVVFKNPAVGFGDGSTIWARGFLGQRVQQADGVVLRNVTNFYGGMIGVDGWYAPDLKLGALAGGGHIGTSIDLNAGSSASDLGFGGVYAHKELGRAFVDLDVIAGGSSNSSSRNINNNLVANGLETATATFGGWFVSPEAVAGYRYEVLPAWTLTPAARLRYLAAGFAGYTETGSTANLTLGSRLAQALEERGELTLSNVQASEVGRFQVAATIGVIGQQRIGDGTINAQILGQALAFATPGKASIAGGFVGGQLDWQTLWGATLYAGAEYDAYSDASSIVTGRAGVKVGF